MKKPYYARWVNRYALATAFCTLVLISIGGLVTSKGVGMAVPDWPTTYGYNMFFFPISKWVGGIFHEHLHRLVASGVGFLTIGLAAFLQWRDPRGWMRWLGWGVLALVCFQGVLGGKRVVLNDWPVLGIPGAVFFGVFHAFTAQVFFSLLVLIGLFTHPAWVGRRAATLPSELRKLPVWASVATGMILLQLVIAATMRHQHAPLPVPDFPLAYGRVYPPSDPEFLLRVNQQQIDIVHDAPVTAFQIHLHMAHRFWAMLIAAKVLWIATKLWRAGGVWRMWGGIWGGLITLQFGLGAMTVWTNKAADFATAHVVGGALSLVTGVALSAWSRRCRWDGGQVRSCEEPRAILQAGASRGMPAGA